MKYQIDKKENISILIFEEKINAGNAETLKDLVKNLLDKKEKNIVFDLSKVDFIDSSGLGSLVGCLRSVKGEGGDIVIVGLIEKVRVVFELIRLHQLFSIYETIDEAVQSFKN
ncbi:MAG: STAS domain-containing protein [Spirochaetia bacterium]|nr:STAS domain-containing protein [Spirochaetia bacterium]